LNALGAARLITERRVPHPAAALTTMRAPCGGLMFPIPSGRKLSLIEIARYWSREIKPSASPEELRLALGTAWWRGELVTANSPSRLNLLRTLYLRCTDYIAFVTPDMPEPPTTRLLDDGDVEVFRRVEILLPNGDPDTWTEASCVEAFEVVAEKWDEKFFSLVAPVVSGIVLSRSDFIRWTEKCRYRRPTFWGGTSKKESELQPSSKATRSKRTKPVQYQIQKAVEALAKEYGGKFPPNDMPVFKRNRLITDWLAGDDNPVKPGERTLRDYFNKQRT
jgi:hypothetical protein